MTGILCIGQVWSKTGGNIPVPTNNGQFWYDASASRYFTMSGAAPYASGVTTTSWTSRFSDGVVVPTSGFGPTYGAGTYSLPNFYYAPNGTATPNVANATAYIAASANTTFTGTIVNTGANQPTATLTVTSTPTGAGLGVGYVLSGGNTVTGTFILKNLTGTGTSSSSTWTVAAPMANNMANSTSSTFTATPVVMNVTAVTSGIVGVGDLVYKSANIGANTFITATTSENSTLTGNGSVGTYLVSVNQTQGNAATPITGYIEQVPYVAFNSGDSFRVPMYANTRVLSSYSVVSAVKFNQSNVFAMGSTHGNGGDLAFGLTTGNVYTFNVANATANGSSHVAGWHVYSVVYDGTGATNSDKYKVWIDGTAQSLTFTGNVLSTTAAPANITSTVTAAAYSNVTDQMVLTYATTGSPAYVAGDSIVVAGLTPTATTDSVAVNGTFTVIACNVTSVTYSIVSNGTYTRSSGGTVAGTPIPNLNVAGKAPTVTGPKNTNGVTATQGLAIGEFVVYDSALSTADRVKAEKYLKNKWLGTN
jgi:hypothetical protein